MKNAPLATTFVAISTGAAAIKLSNEGYNIVDLTSESIKIWARPDYGIWLDQMIDNVVRARWDGNTIVVLAEKTMEAVINSYIDYFVRLYEANGNHSYGRTEPTDPGLCESKKP
jgi:hypothetical protein